MTWNPIVTQRDRRAQSRYGTKGRLVPRDWTSLERLEDRTLLAVSAIPDAYGLIENSPLSVGTSGLLANDSTTSANPLTVSGFTQPANGTLVVNPNGSFQFFPAANFIGADSFTYTLSDGIDTATTTVSLNVAASTPLATVFAGPRLASVDSSQGPLLNALTSSLLGSSLNLNVLDWNGLAGGDINLASLLGVLQTDLGVSSPSAVLTTDATVLQVLNAAATVAQTDGNTALVNALNAQALQLNGLAGTIQLGDLLQIDPNVGSLADVNLNALDLFTGVVQLYNFDNVATTPTPVTISGATLAGLGLPATVGSLELSAQVVEPPIFVRGPQGTQFHTAAIRLKLDLNNLVGLNLDTTALLASIEGVLGVTPITVTANVADLQVYAEIASTSGTIQTIDAITAAVGVQATPGVTNLYIGTIADSVFFDRTHTIVPATDLTFGSVGSLTIAAPLLDLNVSAAIQLRDFALGQAPGSPTLLNFVPPYPSPTQTVGTSAAVITTLAQDLVNNLQVQISGTLGQSLDSIVSTLTTDLVQPLVNGVLAPIVTPLLTGVVDPLLGLLGVGIGQAIVAVQAVGITAAPIANPDFANTAVDTPVTVPILNNDAFAPGDTLTVSSVTQGANGTVVINPNGTVTYTPNAGFVGTDTFTYIATNGTLLSNVTTVSINVVAPGQQVPTAVNDTYSTTAGGALNITLPGVLGNDLSPSGKPLTAAVIGQPANGTLTLDSSGSFMYVPNPGFVGVDTFAYQASDGTFVSNFATVTVNVLPAVQVPTAVNDIFETNAGGTLNVVIPGVLINDLNPSGTPLTAAVVGQPANGTLTLNSNGSFTYVPNVGFVGTDTFTYQAFNGTSVSNVATVVISVLAAPVLVPTAVADQYVTPEGTPLAITVPGLLINDISPNGTPLTAEVVNGPTHGTLRLNADGSFTYVPNAGYLGNDSFSYRNTDGVNFSNPATVVIAVNQVASVLIGPPTVIGLQRFGYHEQTTQIVLTFSEDLNPARAQDPANYVLQSRGRDGRLGTRDDVFILIESAAYDPATRTVTLVTFQRLLKLREHYRLTVVGTGSTGLIGLTGIPLNGQPGTDFVGDFNSHALAGPSTVNGPFQAAKHRAGGARQAALARQAANRLVRQAGGTQLGAKALGRLAAHPHGRRPHA
ncbi:Ig-like domain-containing protein [Singulisphaera sp. Ch08]|uniref:Ig-like domain-containing protein n=1 Tax=Singulisphaera sp. Ch08 TaxID=3120278 RepID=A0AAU7CIU1_9BACT